MVGRPGAAGGLLGMPGGSAGGTLAGRDGIRGTLATGSATL